MNTRHMIGLMAAARRGWLQRVAVCLATAGLALLHLQALVAQTPQSASPVVLDRVVAVVNNQAILSSDLREEMQLSILEPNGASRGLETPARALQQLISRALIRQQIREEDAQAAEFTPEQIAARLADLRKQLPACARAKCTTNAGWKAFLDDHGLTQARVETYLRNRLEILQFIELRFRQGISISHAEIQTYYHDTLVPQYAPGEAVPPLEQVAPRIEEILLQQKVNVLFSDWLDNLRKQGQVEVLDPTLETAATTNGQGTGAQ